jgi:hypothetical protein
MKPSGRTSVRGVEVCATAVDPRITRINTATG